MDKRCVNIDDVLDLFGIRDEDIYAKGTIEDALYDGTLKVHELPSAERRGRWIKKYRGNYLCSVCGAWYRTTDDYGNIIDGEMTANYCESCGAKMDVNEMEGEQNG